MWDRRTAARGCASPDPWLDSRATLSHTAVMSQQLTELLKAPSGNIDLSAFDSGATPGFDGDRHDAPDLMEDLGERLAEEQERLYAGGRSGTCLLYTSPSPRDGLLSRMP